MTSQSGHGEEGGILVILAGLIVVAVVLPPALIIVAPIAVVVVCESIVMRIVGRNKAERSAKAQIREREALKMQREERKKNEEEARHDLAREKQAAMEYLAELEQPKRHHSDQPEL